MCCLGDPIADTLLEVAPKLPPCVTDDFEAVLFLAPPFESLADRENIDGRFYDS